MKKQVILGMVTLLLIGVLTTGAVLAATGTADVTVSYDNRNAIVDPDNPLAEWSVSIPTAVAFAKDKTTKDINVELVPINGATTESFSDTLSIEVKAKSANSMKLIADGEGLSYTVTYGSTSLSGATAATIATLTKVALEQTGTAELGTDKPTKRAMYTDTLTYTITKTKD